MRLQLGEGAKCGAGLGGTEGGGAGGVWSSGGQPVGMREGGGGCRDPLTNFPPTSPMARSPSSQWQWQWQQAGCSGHRHLAGYGWNGKEQSVGGGALLRGLPSARQIFALLLTCNLALIFKQDMADKNEGKWRQRPSRARREKQSLSHPLTIYIIT